MEEKDVQRLLDMLYSMIDEAKSAAFSSDKCVISRDEALDLLDDIRAKLPLEIKKAQELVRAREEYVSSAKKEVEKMLRQAELDAKVIVSESETLQQARRKSSEIIRRAEERSKELYHVANTYTEDALRRTEEAIQAALDECLEALAIRPDGVYLDGTLGRAGHSLEILRRLTAGGRLIGLDRDGTALEAARVRLAEYADRVTLVHSNFSRLAEVLDDLHIDAVDGMLFDLGVSSPQLDDAERGFSYMHDAPLDMRMDRTAGLTARDVVNGWSYEELRRILFEYGEERYAPAIARHIVERRDKAPIETTGQLVEVIRSAMPPAALREKQHPAKRSFQAIRIAVNGELEELPPMLRAAAQRLHPGGRLAVISFHSLEDRIIKKTMQELATGCTCPPNFPVCVCGTKPQMKLVSRKPIVATEAELTYNPRARSAKLRVAEKL